MKKLILSTIFCLFAFSSVGFCDVTYKVKSTATEENPQEVIQMDVIPIIDANQNIRPRADINKNEVYVAPLIAPAQQDKPILNFNLNNVKNIKKGAILPNDNVEQTIVNVVQYFNAPYDKVFTNLLGIIDNSDFELISYDSETGKIFSNYKNEKPVYITVSQYNSNNVMVKITPADGIYDIPASAANKIFSDLNRSLVTK